MTTECQHRKNGSILTCNRCKEERENESNMICNCENNLCGTHPVGACKTPAGQARAMYVGPVCDGCADALDKVYLLADKEGRTVHRPAKYVAINWRNFDAYNGVDDR